MKKQILNICIFGIIGFYSALASSMAYALDDIITPTKKERKEMLSRYGVLGENQQFFSEDQFRAIADNGLSPLVKRLIVHKVIKLEEAQDVVDYAQEIADSKISFDDLEPRIIKYIKKGDTVFGALTKAIKRETLRQRRVNKVAAVREENGPFVQEITQSALSEEEKRRVIQVYASCVALYENEEERELVKPRICDPLDEYARPRHQRSPVNVREMSEAIETTQTHAYESLIVEAKRVADEHNLSTFERVVMAKCFAEQSLRFFVPSHHPLKALHKNRLLSRRSPEATFFMHSGVCTNFSGIAYNVARELGLQGNVFLAKRHLHVYLEVEEDGNWYHSHPFNSLSSCDIIQF